MSAESIAALESKIALNGAPVAEVAEEPVVAESEEAPETTEPEAEEAASSEGAESGGEVATEAVAPPKKKPGVHNRIGELTKEKHEARREADYWRAQALARTAGDPATPKPAATASNDGRPTLESFDYDQDKYLDALAEFKAQSVYDRIQNESKQQAEQAKKNEKQKAFLDRAAAFSETHPEFFDEVFGNSALPVSDTMADFIQDSDQGPEIAWHFRNNPAEAQAIYSLAPREAERALARLENRITAGSSANMPPKKPANITSAPAVANRVAAAAPGKKALSEMDIGDHIAAVRGKSR